MNDRRDDTQKQPWKEAKVITTDSGVCVTVSRQEDTRSRRMRYSYSIGRKVAGKDKPLSHLQAYVDTRSVIGKADLRSNLDEIVTAVKEAEAWIAAEAQALEDRFMDERLAREKKQVDRNRGPAPKPGIGTLGKRDGAMRSAREQALHNLEEAKKQVARIEAMGAEPDTQHVDKGDGEADGVGSEPMPEEQQPETQPAVAEA